MSDVQSWILRGSFLVMISACFPGASVAATATLAVFPLQELGKNRNEVNLPFTRMLADRLVASGNELTDHDTLISFMAHNRIRSVGHLESFHISRVGDELGVAFVLLGTVSQIKERPIPSMGLTLQLVRTSDARTVWSYVGHLSSADTRRLLGVGEPRSVEELQPLLLDHLLASWPWEIVREMQQAASISIDSVLLQPKHLRPGDEVFARVRLRDQWLPNRAPRIFFKADEQIHAASVSADGISYEASWIAGKKNGRFPVLLLLEWPLYGRKETTVLGTYLVDGTLPLFELELRGTQQHGEIPVFRDEVIIMPRLLVRKPLARWRLSFLDAAGALVGADEGRGNLPEHFIWQGRSGTGGMVGNGVYQVVLEAWDLAGNVASASRRVELNRGAPRVEFAVVREGQKMLVDLAHNGKVPLAFWRMEMWSREGRIIKTAEGSELPARIGFELPASASTGEDDSEILGFLLVQDVLGNRSRRKVEELFLAAGGREQEKAEEEEQKTSSHSETWVDEF